MKNIIKSEIYKNLKSWYFKICFFGGCLLISFITIFLPEFLRTVDYSMKDVSDFETSLPFIFVGVAIALIVILPLFADIFKYNTYKNNPRYLLVLPKAKFLTVILFLLIMALIFMASMTICIFRLSAGGDIPLKSIFSCNIKFLATIPNYVAIIAFIQLLTIIIKNEIASIVIYYFIITQVFSAKLIVNSIVYENLGINSHFTPVGEIFNLGGEELSIVGILIGVVVGVIYTVVFNRIGMTYYKKRVYM